MAQAGVGALAAPCLRGAKGRARAIEGATVLATVGGRDAGLAARATQALQGPSREESPEIVPENLDEEESLSNKSWHLLESLTMDDVNWQA